MMCILFCRGAAPARVATPFAAAIALLLLGVPQAASAAQDDVSAEVARVQSEIESMLATAAQDLKRAPEAEKETVTEREKAAALEKDVAAAKAEADAAQAGLTKYEDQAKAAEEELAAQRQKAAALDGYKKAALEKLAHKPLDRAKAVAAVALADRAILETALGRVLAEPGAQGAAAFDELVKGAATALPQADFEKLGSDTRARPSLAGKPDVSAQLDALSVAINEAAACEGVAPGALPGKVARIVAGPMGRRAAANRLGAQLAARIRTRREALLREGNAVVPRLQAALGSARLARAVARLAVLRGLREVIRDAAKASLGLHVVPIVGDVLEAPLPRKVIAPLLRRIGKRRGGACNPSEAR